MRHRLAEVWPGLAAARDPKVADDAVARCGLDACVAACIAEGRRAKEAPGSLGFFSRLLADLRPVEVEAPRPVPVLDMSWLQELQGARRTEAEAAWAAARADVEQTFAPPVQPRALASAMEVVRGRFLS